LFVFCFLFYLCYLTEPFQPLGLSDGRIPNNLMTASSFWDGHHPPSHARLHWTKYGNDQVWASKTLDLNQWLQIDLSTMHFVTALATQGRHGSLQWVKSYWFSYSNDGTTFTQYKDQNQARKVSRRNVFLVFGTLDVTYTNTIREYIIQLCRL